MMFLFNTVKAKALLLAFQKNNVARSLIDWLVFMLVGISCQQLSAAEIAAADVKLAVETWVQHETADARPGARVASMVPWEIEGRLVGYVAHLQDGGFLLCGADSLVLPVYYYSPDGEFDPELEDYQYILWEIGARKAFFEAATVSAQSQKTSNLQSFADRSDYWQRLIAGVPDQRIKADELQSVAPNTMSLDLTTRWDQVSPYNDYCPHLTPGQDEHVFVGCVATAAAQLMKYWKWPASGVGSSSQDYRYRWRDDWDVTPLAGNPAPDQGDNWSAFNGRLAWTANNDGELSMFGYWDQSLYQSAQRIDLDNTDYIAALDILWNRLTLASTPNQVDFSTAGYNWDIMPDTAVDPPQVGDLEVAKLSYHVGVAVNMNWGVDVSTSGTPNALSALEDHFLYQSGASHATVATPDLIEEIQWLRPAFLDGCRSIGGCHVWLVVGYNLGVAPDHQFMINLGGGDGNTGWYTLDSMEFNMLQSQGIRVAPTRVKFVGAASPGDGSPNAPYIDINEALLEAPDDSTLVFKAGSQNIFSGSALIIDRPLTLKGYDITIE